MVGAIASPPSSLTAAQPVSFMIREALANACSGERFVAAERHVDGDQRMPAAAHDGGAMSAHHLHRHRDGRRQAVDHLAEAVADQQHVAMRIEQLRHAHRVGGQHHDRLLGLAAIALRARIEGAVMRLPGTGDGVARLVEVSIVKVDMPARGASNGRSR